MKKESDEYFRAGEIFGCGGEKDGKKG